MLFLSVTPGGLPEQCCEELGLILTPLPPPRKPGCLLPMTHLLRALRWPQVVVLLGLGFCIYEKDMQRGLCSSSKPPTWILASSIVTRTVTNKALDPGKGGEGGKGFKIPKTDRREWPRQTQLGLF